MHQHNFQIQADQTTMKFIQSCILLVFSCVVLHFVALWSYSNYHEWLSTQQQLPSITRTRTTTTTSLLRSTSSTSSPINLHNLPIRTNGFGAASSNILPRHALGKFKLAGDPALCLMRKWRWCYVSGNVETFRRVFTNSKVGLSEIPPIPLDIEGGAPWQLKWQLADEADGNDYASYRTMSPVGFHLFLEP